MPAAEFQAGNLTIATMDPRAFGGQEFRPTAPESTSGVEWLPRHAPHRWI